MGDKMKCYICRKTIDEYNIGEVCIKLNSGEILKKDLCKECIMTLSNGIIQCHKETAPTKLQNHVSMMNSQCEIDLSKLQSEIEDQNKTE